MRDTKEVITVCCPTCHRPGFKTQRTTWLVTEIDLDAFKYMNDGNSDELLNIFERARVGFPNSYIGAFVAGSATISEACREGVAVANAEGRPVVFHFMSGATGSKYDPVVVCEPNSDPDAIVARWWKGARDARGED